MPCRTLLSIYSARKHMTSKTIKMLGEYVLTVLTQTTKHDKGIIKEGERGRVSVYLTDCVSGGTVSIIFCVFVCDYGVKTLREHFSCIYPATYISARSRRSTVQISPCKWSRGAGVIFALARQNCLQYQPIRATAHDSYITFCTQCKRAIYALHCRAYMEVKCTTAQLECISYLYCTSETSAI
eukprot:sb/3471515/